MTQEQALTILKTGANVFLTGEPGAGKTHTVNAYVRYLRQAGVEVAITASTGIAATHIGGMTIHSWSGIGIRRNLDPYDLDKIASNERIVKRIRRAAVLIIDEVSMLAAQTLDMVEQICREIKDKEHPFGGMQVVLVGDFFQLPPVSNAGQAVAFAYESSAWLAANPLICYLTEQFRQDDANFLDVLGAIRGNSFDEDHLAHISQRKIDYEEAPPDVPKLFSHNVDVDRVNEAMLAQLPAKPKIFTMAARGPAALVLSLQKGCLSPERLQLKTGAAVMFTKNNSKEGFVNGTLGTVAGFDAFTRYPLVETRRGRTIAVEPMEWTVEENGQIRARLTQLPLRLAWAITVHKSQGMSLDEAVMDLSQVFEFGQGYVALSRVRRLNGVHLLGWNEQTFKVHPSVLEQDVLFRTASQQAEAAFGQMTPGDVATLQQNFLKASGGKIRVKSERKRGRRTKAAIRARLRMLGQ